jgi:hypothetical protein
VTANGQVKSMSIFKAWLIASAFILCPVVVEADELPKELLLQCNGKSMVFLMEGDRTTGMKSDTFEGLQLRLKDQTVVNTGVDVVYGKGCRLENGKIRCELNEVVYSPEFNSTEKRHLWVSLVRETGELRLSIETWTFDGKTTAGKPRLSSRVQRAGVCQTISKPLF